MSKLSEAKARLRERKAAALGMSLEQFDAYVKAEQEKLDAQTRALTDRAHCHSVIKINANYFKRSFTKLS